KYARDRKKEDPLAVEDISICKLPSKKGCDREQWHSEKHCHVKPVKGRGLQKPPTDNHGIATEARCGEQTKYGAYQHARTYYASKGSQGIDRHRLPHRYSG